MDCCEKRTRRCKEGDEKGGERAEVGETAEGARGSSARRSSFSLSSSLAGREARILQAYEVLESGMQLLGATGCAPRRLVDKNDPDR